MTSKIKFNGSEKPTVGMELELFTLDKDSLALTNGAPLILNHFKKSSLPSNINKFFSKKNINKILSFMQKDKKNISKRINLILLKRIGYPIINNSYKINYIKSFLKNELNN